MSKWTGSYVTDILAALTTAMGVDNQLGAQVSAGVGAPARIVWQWRKDEKFYAPAQQRDEGHVIWDVDQRFDVQVWRDDVRTAEDLFYLLIAKLDELYSPNAYRPNDATPAGEGAGDNGYQLFASISLLRVPIYSRLANPVTLTSATAQGTLTGPKGNAPTPTMTITRPIP